MSIVSIEIQHDQAARKYYALVDGQESVCEYGEAGEKTLNFWHTYVPPALRGRGIAEQLVHQALEDARDRGLPPFSRPGPAQGRGPQLGGDPRR